MKFKDTKYGDLNGQDYKGDIDVIGMNLTSLGGAPTKEDFKLYKKIGDRKYWKIKNLKDSL